MAPERIWKWGAPVRRKSGGHRSGAKCRNFFLVVPLHFFGSKSTISRFGERFRDGQYSLVSFLFSVFYSRCSPCLTICKGGEEEGHVLPCPMESAPLIAVCADMPIDILITALPRWSLWLVGASKITYFCWATEPGKFDSLGGSAGDEHCIGPFVTFTFSRFSVTIIIIIITVLFAHINTVSMVQVTGKED